MILNLKKIIITIFIGIIYQHTYDQNEYNILI